MTPVLDIRRLRVERGDTVILREINWRVAPGENWVILGANGSGKTSLLKSLTGFLAPTAGEFSVLGRSYGATDWRTLRLHIGVVTSAFAAAIPPAEVALETVISGKFAQLDLWARVTAAERTAARRWLRVVGAERVAEREWLYLSQGERQRVLIARALMAKPRLLIFDEPCAGLDPVARQSFLELVDRLARRQTAPRVRNGRLHGRHARATPALVLVTHHVEEITPAFTHALLLRRGEVVAAGPRDAVLTSRNLSTAFGAPLRLATRGGRMALSFR
ncbi:ABC transporter ATP-binding protein [Opitutus terrae]|uniref:ABC transporter related n=1 Tax=Opitutus terrae (strain DSM 11246 / JCM 15787 / PB90-1) TaxID=452637 RepID=B1ZWI5_OPITP|nr:ATP-binding cassette domain-containing protein [Opitutus terrae]ACB73309.1 ABC transporter related [Opitutus terrae PB90-1]